MRLAIGGPTAVIMPPTGSRKLVVKALLSQRVPATIDLTRFLTSSTLLSPAYSIG